jgi:hypothetical protein
LAGIHLALGGVTSRPQRPSQVKRLLQGVEVAMLGCTDFQRTLIVLKLQVEHGGLDKVMSLEMA